MPAHWASPVKRRLKDTVLAVALALALYIGAGVPGLQPGVAAAAPAMAAIDCPMQDKRDAETSLGCCILCSMPSLVTASGTDPFIIPLRLSLGAALPFATGVSATHGPALTANLATGPPIACSGFECFHRPHASHPWLVVWQQVSALGNDDRLFRINAGTETDCRAK